MIEEKIYEGGEDNCGLLRENVSQTQGKTRFVNNAPRLEKSREPRSLSAPAKCRSRKTFQEDIYY